VQGLQKGGTEDTKSDLYDKQSLSTGCILLLLAMHILSTETTHLGVPKMERISTTKSSSSRSVAELVRLPILRGEFTQSHAKEDPDVAKQTVVQRSLSV